MTETNEQATNAIESSTLLDAVREAFLAGEKQGQANAESIYRSSYPEAEPDEAADKYVLKFEASNVNPDPLGK
jgi:hypothetical protein